MTPKELKKLAAACRAAGITTFKNSEIEFTLGDVPVKASQKNHKAESNDTSVIDEAFKEDTLTEEQMLFWSTAITEDVTEPKGTS